LSTAANTSFAGTFLPKLLIDDSVSAQTPSGSQSQVRSVPFLSHEGRLHGIREASLTAFKSFPGETPAVLNHQHEIFWGSIDQPQMLREELQTVLGRLLRREQAFIQRNAMSFAPVGEPLPQPCCDRSETASLEIVADLRVGQDVAGVASHSSEAVNTLHERQQIRLPERSESKSEYGENRIDLAPIGPAAFLPPELLLELKPSLEIAIEAQASAVRDRSA
jgi:hypothetical protein